MEFEIDETVSPDGRLIDDSFNFTGADDDALFTVSGRARIEGKTAVIERLEIESSSNITANTLRTLRLGELRQAILISARSSASDAHDLRQRFRDEVAPKLLQSYEHEPQGLREMLQQGLADQLDIDNETVANASSLVHTLRITSPNRGRGVRSDNFYRDIAISYIQLLGDGDTTPIVSLTNEWNSTHGENLSRNTVSTWVRRSREEGWLSRSTQGRAGGEPGPRLIAWLNQKVDPE